MATYKEIQDSIRKKHNVAIKTCWIAHAKEIYGLPVKRTWNRNTTERKIPCPDKKLILIKEAFENFQML